MRYAARRYFENLQSSENKNERQTQFCARTRLKSTKHENSEECHGEVDNRVDTLGSSQKCADVNAPTID